MLFGDELDAKYAPAAAKIREATRTRARAQGTRGEMACMASASLTYAVRRVATWHSGALNAQRPTRNSNALAYEVPKLLADLLLERHGDSRRVEVERRREWSCT